MSDGSGVPAGWYADGAGTVRWWDGNVWTQHVQPRVESVVPSAAPVTPDVVPATSVETTLTTPVATWAPASVTAAPIRQGSGRDVSGGAWYLLAAVSLMGLSAITYQIASRSGGLVWTGAFVVGVILMLRGLGLMAAERSTTRRTLHGAADQLADPWEAHRASKARDAARPGGKRFVPTWIVVGSLLLVVGGIAAVILVPWSSLLPAQQPAAQTAAAAPAVHAAAAPAGWRAPEGWTPVGDDSAYLGVEPTASNCVSYQGKCGLVEIIHRTRCAKLRVHYELLDLQEVPVATGTQVVKVKANKPVMLTVGTDSTATHWHVDSINCL